MCICIYVITVAAKTPTRTTSNINEDTTVINIMPEPVKCMNQYCFIKHKFKKAV